jgi:hypothetical protein
MTTNALKAKQDAATSVARQTYASPELRCFGAVAALTQGGTGPSSELNPKNNKCSGSKKEQRC